jgi:hypothetical protein
MARVTVDLQEGFAGQDVRIRAGEAGDAHQGWARPLGVMAE